jgi:hypothetical protein
MPGCVTNESYQKPEEPAVVGNERKHLAEGSQNYQIFDMPRKLSTSVRLNLWKMYLLENIQIAQTMVVFGEAKKFISLK